MADVLEQWLGDPVDPNGEEGPKQPKRPTFFRRPLGKIVLVLIIIVVLAGAGVGVWYLGKKQQDKQHQTAAQQAASIANLPVTDTPNTTQLKTYTSQDLTLKLSYPADWTASEANGGLTIISPSFTFQTIDGGSVMGNFRIYIREGARAVDDKYIGEAVAAQPSTTLTYTNPGVGQVATTNLTQFGIPTADHFTFLMDTGAFNLSVGQTLGPAYGQESGTYIIAGGYGSKDLTDDLAFNNVSLSQSSTKRAYQQALNIIKSIRLN